MLQGDKLRLLVVDDDHLCAQCLASLAEEDGYEVAVAGDGGEALETAESFEPDAVVTDLQMPGISGNELLRELRRRDPGLPVIILTAYAEIPTAVDAMHAGALDYVPKPAHWSVIARTLETALERRAIAGGDFDGQARLRELLGLGLGGLVGRSAVMQSVYDHAHRAARSRTTVLITGETGTGKGELARALHDASPRSDGPFVVMHCAAIPETLLESELFGHERGAFTGALTSKMGRFEQAEGGTLFIDEVADIPVSVQTKLLRLVQEKTFERVGGNDVHQADVRIIAATNGDLTRAVRDGRFRTDLFYRLNVIPIEMPPLRARHGDLELLARYFLARSASANGKKVTGFTEDAMRRLSGHTWPGNVRELEHAVEHGVVMTESTNVSAECLPKIAVQVGKPSIPGATMKEIECQAIRATFQATGKSTKRTAELLGLSQRTVQYRLAALGLARARGRPPKARAG